jgi:hypothetical protein
MYRAAQNPANWLLSAERLRDAAEIILSHEQAQEVPYFQAHEAASQKALALAYTGTNKAGTAEIACEPPNYPPAQVLYAYSIENVLKGIIVANDATVVDENKISRTLKSHDLIALAADARVQVHVQEKPVLAALSDLSVWAGRYPVALTKEDYIGKENPHAMLDYGSQNVIMRLFLKRTLKELEAKLQRAPGRFDVVVVFRQPGT